MEVYLGICAPFLAPSTSTHVKAAGKRFLAIYWYNCFSSENACWKKAKCFLKTQKFWLPFPIN